MKIAHTDIEVFVGTGGLTWQAENPTLLFLHGAGMNRTVWVLLARYFARHGYNIVAADLPGHGATGGFALPCIEEQAGFITELVEILTRLHGLPAEPINIIGHSMGALIACEVAGLLGDQVDRLILLGAGYPMQVSEVLLEAAKANDQSAVDMIAIYSHALASQLGHNHVAGISVQNTAMALLEQAAPGVLYADLKACNDYQGLEETAVKLRQLDKLRSLLVSGDADRMTPLRAAGKTAELIGADHLILSNSGHMMMSEQPEQTLQALRSFLASEPAGRDTD